MYRRETAAHRNVLVAVGWPRLAISTNFKDGRIEAGDDMANPYQRQQAGIRMCSANGHGGAVGRQLGVQSGCNIAFRETVDAVSPH